MNQSERYPRLVRSLIADASRTQGSTLFFIFQVDGSGRCEVHEQLPDGGCSVWPQSYARRYQAEDAIYQQEWRQFLTRPVRQYTSLGYSSLDHQFAELARLRYATSRDATPVGIIAFRAPAPDPRRVIVADAHEWIRTILVEVVRQTLPTADVVATADGLQALEAFQSGTCHFLVSNHSMPRMDGFTLIRRVRQDAPDLPIVMISTKAEARLDAMKAGANWFLTKEQIMEHLPRLLLRYAVDGIKPVKVVGR